MATVNWQWERPLMALPVLFALSALPASDHRAPVPGRSLAVPPPAHHRSAGLFRPCPAPASILASILSSIALSAG